ncbi:MAG: ATP-binding cassette domain-containing protein [Deltaproteobacteria bacterium]|nr:ATP-binding cassette domain-containing protein [Deltaproteobacteria bacterium]
MSAREARDMAGLLAVEGLSFAYPGRPPIIAGLGFEARGGDILGLAGANGAGKSTLLDLLSGLLAPDRGRIALSGRSGAGELRKRSALLPQNVDYFLLGDSPREDLGLALARGAPGAGGLDCLAGHWDLAGVLDQPVETLSLGQKKRLALASALAAGPELLLLDEPFSGLDWPGCLKLVDDLAGLARRELIVVLATHEPGLVRDLAGRWLLLGSRGHLLAEPAEAFGRLADFGVRPVC